MNHFRFVVVMTLFFISGNLFSQGNKEIFKYKLGDSELILLSESQGYGNISILLGATPEMIAECIPDSVFPNAMNAFLFRTPEKNILIDAGLGTKIFDYLDKLKVKREDIDIVLITHMHGDHIGGLLKDGEVAFPNATLYISYKEHDYWMDDQEMAKLPINRQGGFQKARDVIKAYNKRIVYFYPQQIGKKNEPILPGIEALAASGHTQGHVMYLLASGDEKILVWGDLIHAMDIQMPYPQVAVTYDTNPNEATIARMNILKYISNQHLPIAGMHIPYPAIGIIKDNEKGGYQFIPVKK